MTDDRLELAYEAGVHALSQQDTTLGNLRNRATGLLSAAALVTSFSAGLGLINTDPNKGTIFPTSAAVALFVILVVIGTLSMVVLWPVRNWQFGPDSVYVVSAIDADKTIDEIRRYVAERMGNARVTNGRALGFRMWCYRIAVVLLIVEVLVVVLALIYG